MTAVVQDDVWWAKLINQALEKFRIALIADPHFHLIFLKCFALRIDVHSNNPCMGVQSSASTSAATRLGRNQSL
jgi:hypothetical protein